MRETEAHRARALQPSTLIFAQDHVQGPEIVLKLLHRPYPHDRSSDRRLPDIDVDIAVDHWIGDDRVGAELRLIGFDELLVLRIVDRLEVVPEIGRASCREGVCQYV